ncbi:MAG: DNA-formamidopyrimidine glycosylase family protein [Nocardioidaceae bacterium]
MPEGHTLFRLAAGLHEHFAGREVSVTSPQGRFAEAAALLDGTRLEGAHSYGKHLFVDFEQERCVHVHLGLYGKFVVATGAASPPVGQVRLRLVAGAGAAPVGAPAYADLRGATACELMTTEQRLALVGRLGPDPLRPDADWTRAWDRVSRSRIPVGALLMDQSVLAGVGNVYRAEVLFRHRVDPMRPGRTLRRSMFERIWNDLVVLLADGVHRGRIDTVHVPADEALVGRVQQAATHGSPVYVYRRDGRPCFVCGATVRTEELAGRNLFWCPRCQPRFRSRARAA